MPPALLVAIDIDGTLIKTDGSIAAVDRGAIARARAAGIIVTLATGRLSPDVIPLASELGLDRPLICADGGVIVEPDTSVVLKAFPLPPDFVLATLTFLRDRGLAPFVFTHQAIVGAVEDVRHAPFLSDWTDCIEGHPDLDEFLASASAPDALIMLAVGAEADVREARHSLPDKETGALEVDIFPIRSTKHWALRLVSRDCTKGNGLAHLATQLGLEPDDVAAIGDWYNDISMLDWAGHSFAMGHAPDDVRDAAEHCLTATADTGGGVAEMIDHLLDPEQS